MHARVVLGVGKGVLFREVSSVQKCPHREREVPLYTNVYVYIYTALPPISSKTTPVVQIDSSILK